MKVDRGVVTRQVTFPYLCPTDSELLSTYDFRIKRTTERQNTYEILLTMASSSSCSSAKTFKALTFSRVPTGRFSGLVKTHRAVETGSGDPGRGTVFQQHRAPFTGPTRKSRPIEHGRFGWDPNAAAAPGVQCSGEQTPADPGATARVIATRCKRNCS